MTTAEPISVLCLRRTDSVESPVVLLIYKKSKQELDLEFIASEGSEAWSAAVEGSNIAQLKDSNYEASNEIWHEIVKTAFGLQRPGKDLVDEATGLEVVATISARTMSLIVRRNVGGLTQRLGRFELQEADGDAFDLWAGCVAGGKIAAEARKSLDFVEVRLAEQIQNNRKLQEQLNELIESKKEHEDALFVKFTALLNGKKMKIREQQRVLATATMDEAALSKAVAVSPVKDGTSRGSKRKATTPAPESESSDGGFETVAEDENDWVKDVSTPEPMDDNDDTTEDEDEDEDEDDRPPEVEPKKGIKKALPRRAKSPTSPPPRDVSQSSRIAGRASQTRAKFKEPSEGLTIPPGRELRDLRRPATREAEKKFSQSVARAQSQIKSDGLISQPAGGNDDDATDDEL